MTGRSEARLGGRHVKPRRQAQAAFAAADDVQPLLAERALRARRRARVAQLDREQQPGAAHLVDELVRAGLLEQPAQLRANLREAHRLQRGVGLQRRRGDALRSHVGERHVDQREAREQPLLLARLQADAARFPKPAAPRKRSPPAAAWTTVLRPRSTSETRHRP